MSPETFDAAWLALREPVDHRSRAASLLPPLREWWHARGASAVLDLACGTGSNLRYLAPHLPGRQVWTLVDHDPGLLARVETPEGRVVVQTVRGNLSGRGLAAVERADLVTGSALLDLVSERWLNMLADSCAAVGCAVLFSLTYDGTIAWEGPAGDGDRDDELVREAVNRHQRRDKGVGPAAGPEAGRLAEEAFRARGYRAQMRATPWRLGADDAELVRALVAGWAAAAQEERPDAAARIRRWATQRSARASAADLELTVGHVDLLALPTDGADDRP